MTPSEQPPAWEVQEQRFFLAGEWREGTPYQLTCPYDDAEVAVVHRAGPRELELATERALRAFEHTRKLPGHRRAAVLRSCAERISARAEELARTIALEAGKPIRQARVEVARSAVTFATAAEEATRFHDELLHLDAVPGGESRQGLLRRFPIGPIAAIAPFNFPLNLVAHKLAPAIAAGCPAVLKPASQTPLSALKLAEIIVDAGWPAEALSVLPLRSQDAAPLVEDERFKLLTFTGSPAVGWDMRRRAGRKKVILELGGNAGAIIHSDADLAYAVERCVAGGYGFSGQSCVSLQRVFVHRSLYAAFLELFVPSVAALKPGHPLDEHADLGPLISAAEAARVAEWLREARGAGASCPAGGVVHGSMVQPTVLLDAAPELRVNSQEIFAPVVTVQPYDDFAEALRAVNASIYGLQAGMFTSDVRAIFRAYEELEVGGLIVNDVPTWRLDPMPYGGVKQSGLGREGLKYAVEEMTEPKLLVLNLSV